MKFSHNRILYIFFCCIIIVTISIYLTKQTSEQEMKKVETFVENEIIKNKQMNRQLDLLTYSKFSPDCCPGTYSSSSGCLCDNHDEAKAIYTRGGNRHYCD